MSRAVAITDRKRTLIFINIIITCIASSMLATALTTALPPIVRDFQISVTTGQWLTSGYSLAMAIMMPLTAFLINRFPARKLYITAIVVFLAGLALCAVSVNFPMMMAARIIQAAGNGILTSMAQVVVLSIFPPEKKGAAMGWYGLSVGAAPVVAPTLAGILVDNFGWRMIFFISIAIMAVSLIYAIAVFDNVLDTAVKKFDLGSFVLSALAFGGTTLGIGNVGSHPLASPQVLLTLAVGLVAAVFFVRRQLHLEDPFLELRILRIREYAVSVLGSVLLYFIMMGATILLPLYVQQTMGLSATVSGLVSLPGSLAMAICSPFAGKLYDKVGMKPLFVTGAACLFLGSLGMFFITTETSVWVAAALNVVRCLAIGCLMMPLVTWGASHVEREKTSHATALLTSLRTIAGAIGSAVFVAVMSLVAASSAGSYGANAGIHGVNVAFLAMTVSSLALLAVGIVGCRPKAQ